MSSRLTRAYACDMLTTLYKFVGIRTVIGQVFCLMFQGSVWVKLERQPNNRIWPSRCRWMQGPGLQGRQGAGGKEGIANLQRIALSTTSLPATA